MTLQPETYKALTTLVRHNLNGVSGKLERVAEVIDSAIPAAKVTELPEYQETLRDVRSAINRYAEAIARQLKKVNRIK